MVNIGTPKSRDAGFQPRQHNKIPNYKPTCDNNQGETLQRRKPLTQLLVVELQKLRLETVQKYAS